MIKFFRKIRYKLMETGKTGKYFKYAIGEIVLVVIGILIALQINNWNESRKVRAQELSSMKEIIENLKYDILRCEKNSANNTMLIHGLDSLRTSVSNSIDGKDETANIYYYSLKYGSGYNVAVINKSAYNELINSGSIKGIRNRTLVQKLSDYYERIVFSVEKYIPKIGHVNFQNMQKKFISFKGFESYIQSFDSINPNSFSVNYDFKNIKNMNQLELLKPNGLDLNDYYNEITQFEIDLKNYMFYMSWTKDGAKNLIRDIEKEYQLTGSKL